MTTPKTKLMTADDLMRLSSEGVRGELIRGALHETMPTGVNHSRTVLNLGAEMRSFVKPRRLGTLMASDLGVRLERDPDTVREPDIAFISAERLPLDADVPGYLELVPDLVVEVASPNDNLREIHEKVLMWMGYGVRLVWVPFPSTRTVDVYHADGTTSTLTEDDTLDGGNVLPGFICRVSEIFSV